MVVHNGERHLRAAVDSLLAQTFPDFELIVVDGGSTDSTTTILQDYAAKDRRIRHLRSEHKEGLTNARNRALYACRSPLAAIADADDVFAPGRLAQQVAFLNQHPEIGMVGSAFELIDDAGRIFGKCLPLCEDKHIRFQMLLTPCFHNGTIMFRTELMKAIGGYAPEYTVSAEDYDTWAKLRDHTQFANLPACLCQKRHHPGSFSSQIDPVLNCSLVAHRLIGSYVGRPIEVANVYAAVTLYGWGRPMDEPAIQKALLVCRQLLEAGARHEDAETLGAYRAEVARHLLEQARMQTCAARQLGRRLLRESLRWDLRLLRSRAFAFQAFRNWMPVPLRRAAKKIAARLRTARPR
jgi:cellulose synthase/poly-beta-1,6-N-acetylglucosamine synthase-like glycosyltransferase